MCLFTRELQSPTSSCNECTPLVQKCPFCIGSNINCSEHEMENKHRHRLRERVELEDLSEVAGADRVESYMDTFVANLIWLKN